MKQKKSFASDSFCCAATHEMIVEESQSVKSIWFDFLEETQKVKMEMYVFLLLEKKAQ